MCHITAGLSKCRNQPAASIIIVPFKVNTDHPADIHFTTLMLLFLSAYTDWMF